MNASKPAVPCGSLPGAAGPVPGQRGGLCRVSSVQALSRAVSAIVVF